MQGTQAGAEVRGEAEAEGPAGVEGAQLGGQTRGPHQVVIEGRVGVDDPVRTLDDLEQELEVAEQGVQHALFGSVRMRVPEHDALEGVPDRGRTQFLHSEGGVRCQTDRVSVDLPEREESLHATGVGGDVVGGSDRVLFTDVDPLTRRELLDAGTDGLDDPFGAGHGEASVLEEGTDQVDDESEVSSSQLDL